MQVKPNFLLLSIVACLMLLSGCAISTSTIDIDTSKLSVSNQQEASETVYVRTVVDEREFVEGKKDSSKHAINPIDKKLIGKKPIVIGRKSNYMGIPLSNIILPETQNVSMLAKSAIESALIENGWNVLKNESEINNRTKIVDVKVLRFWTWVTPGFWSITLWADIKSDVPKSPSSNEKVTIEGKYSENFQTGVESNYRKVLQEAYDAFEADAKAKLGKPSK